MGVEIVKNLVNEKCDQPLTVVDKFVRYPIPSDVDVGLSG